MSALITPQRIRDHVQRLGEQHPPVPLDSVDRTILNPALVRERFSGVLSYMARVEMEVERNVLELVVLLPGVDPVNEQFYRDVWAPQELHHGLILDRLGEDLGMGATEANTEGVSAKVRVLGALSHLAPIQEVIKLLYYLTGAATEKSAVLAYNKLRSGLIEMNETAIATTIIDPIKVQEPGHFAFYKFSTDQLVQSGALSPWQLHLARFLRSRKFTLVGANNKSQEADYGRVMTDLGLDADINTFARDIARVETNLLWAHKEGMSVPDYVLRAFREAVEMHRVRTV